jgi:hypothetical protein
MNVATWYVVVWGTDKVVICKVASHNCRLSDLPLQTGGGGIGQAPRPYYLPNMLVRSE